MAQEDRVPDEPTLTVRITPLKPYLQEEILQVIRVIAPHPFEEIVLDLPPVEGAEIITLQPPKNRKFETYGGEGYIFETSRAIFPKRSGELEIPPVRISGSVGISRNERKPFALRSELSRLDVRPPPETFSEDWWLVARDVTIDHGWSRPLDDLRVGDRVTRSITVTVAGVTGEHLPELEQGRSNGLTVLPGRTERSTDITPSGVIGKISRSFDIRVDVDQPINISPVRLVWWNTSTEIERRSAAPAVRIEPLPRDIDGLVMSLMEEASEARTNSQRGILAIALGIAALVVALLILLFGSKRRTRPEDRRLEAALKSECTPLDAILALEQWAKAGFSEKPFVNLEKLGEWLGPEAQQKIEDLQKAAFGKVSGSVDIAGSVLQILRMAQTQRSKDGRGNLANLMDRFLGPETTLPSIDHQSLEQQPFSHAPRPPLSGPYRKE